MGIIIQKKLTTSAKPTGSTSQVMEQDTVLYVLAKENFSFANITASQLLANWNASKKTKDIVVMFSVEAIELSNTEATYEETRTKKFEVKSARKGIKFTHKLDHDSYAALKSYVGQGYNRIIEVTRDNYVVLVEQTDGTLKGQKVEMILSPRNAAAGETLSDSVVEFVYEDFNELEDNAVLMVPSFNARTLEGIFPLKFDLVSSSATSIVVKASVENEINDISGLLVTDFKLTKADGSLQTIASVTSVANQYTLTGTFVAGTLESNGVLDKTTAMYETTNTGKVKTTV